jgi:hypothetical protein
VQPLDHLDEEKQAIMIGDSTVEDKFEGEINYEGDSNIFGCDEGEYSPEIYPHHPLPGNSMTQLFVAPSCHHQPAAHYRPQTYVYRSDIHLFHFYPTNSGVRVAVGASVNVTEICLIIAKLSPSSSSSWTELALLSLLYQPANLHYQSLRDVPHRDFQIFSLYIFNCSS